MADLSQIRVKGTLYDLKDVVARSAIGGPSAAATVAAMVDTSKIYIYTGSETGYTAGNWYYYDGTEWQSGGIYNATAVNTDTTLSQAGVAADAKKVGDAIDGFIEVGTTPSSEYTQLLVSPTSVEVDIVTEAEFDTAISELSSAVENVDKMVSYPLDTDGDIILPVGEKMLTVHPDGASDYQDIPEGDVKKNLLLNSYSDDDSKTKVSIVINTSGTPVTGEVKGLRYTMQVLHGNGTVGSVGMTGEDSLWYVGNGVCVIIPVIAGHSYKFATKTPKVEDTWYAPSNVYFAPDFDFTFTEPYVIIPKTKGSIRFDAEVHSDGRGRIFDGAWITVPEGMNYMIIGVVNITHDSSEPDGVRNFEIYDYTEYPWDATYDKIVEDPLVGDVYTVSYALTRATSSNRTTSVDGSSQYTTTITADPGKIISTCTVKVANQIYEPTDNVITVNNADSNIKITAIAEALPDDAYVGAYSIKRELIPEDLLSEKMDTPAGLKHAEAGQMLFCDGDGGLTVADAPLPTSKVTMEWQDVFSYWAGGYMYDPSNDYAYTVATATDTCWDLRLDTGMSCTPFDNLIPVEPGERYRMMTPSIMLDRINDYLPGMIIFDANKNVILPVYLVSSQGGTVYTEVVIPKNGAYMAVHYWNSQSWVFQKHDVRVVDKFELLNAIHANYRTYLLSPPPVKKQLDKAYFCIGADDLRAQWTKPIHDALSAHNIPYYLASIPEAIKQCVHGADHKTNYDYMQLCLAGGGEIVCHSADWIHSGNVDDFDALYQYFNTHKRHLEFFGFDVHGIFKAGGDGAIGLADKRLDAWATYYYDYSDAFGYAFPYNFLSRGNTILEWATEGNIDRYMQRAFDETSYACFAMHEFNDHASAMFDRILSNLSGYTRGVDYEWVTPYELYQKLMPDPTQEDD